ncbi:MAG TPA: hypothetical protein VGU24_08345 [Microvirga sp.]|jgi:hypothetical protein|nr:hypothetical protein [Microvirga sp.]
MADLERLVELANARDELAFQRLASAKRCKVLERGTPIHAESVRAFRSVSCVRPRGEPECYWVPMNRTE